jgi:hypothetical protein
MFSTCRRTQTIRAVATRTAILLSAILLTMGACSKQPAPPAQPTSAAPLVTSSAQTGESQRDEAIAGKLVAAGVAATYHASFAADQLQRIVETRAEAGTGEYEFQGARLMRYTGNALSNDGTIELGFDLQGAVKISKSGSGAVPADEVSAIRTRAQLLRSHALAQRATRSHQ